MASLELRDVEAQARARLDSTIFDFFAGGADDEFTLGENEAAFASLGLVPRVLSGAPPTLETTLLGKRLTSPIVISPTAFHKLAHSDGESATARAARDRGALFIVSMAATTPLDEIRRAAPEGNLWFQIYLQPDRDFMLGVIRRAEECEVDALVVTVDSPVFGRRLRDVRNGFTDLPAGLFCENMRDSSGHLRPIAFTPQLSWNDIDWLRSKTDLRVVLKGIAHPEDADVAVSRGVDGIIVSNHGGRQLDGMMPSIDLLPDVVDVCARRVPVLVDGGVRRGTDVLKALALGASAVGIGRSVLWGLAYGGEAGVRDVLRLFDDELTRAMVLCGVTTTGHISRNLVRSKMDRLRW